MGGYLSEAVDITVDAAGRPREEVSFTIQYPDDPMPTKGKGKGKANNPAPRRGPAGPSNRSRGLVHAIPATRVRNTVATRPSRNLGPAPWTGSKTHEMHGADVSKELAKAKAKFTNESHGLSPSDLVHRVVSLPGGVRVRPADVFSETTTEYLQLVTDPFVRAHDANIPTYPAFPSRKLSVFANTTVSTGTAGFGFIVLRPLRGVGSDGTVAYKSGPTYGGTTLVASGTGVSAVSTNSDYVNSDIGASGAKYRLVAFGVRARYMGIMYNEGGRVSGLTEPNHGSLIGLEYGGIRAYTDARAVSPDQKEWTELIWTPISDTDMSYSDSISGENSMAMVFESPDSSIEEKYEVEIYGHYELIGSTVRGKSPSEADIVGADTVWNTTQQWSNGIFNTSAKANVKAITHSSVNFIKDALANYAKDATGGLVNLLGVSDFVDTSKKTLSYMNQHKMLPWQ